MNEYWYALRVKPRFEKLITTQLEEKGYETLLPTYVSRRKWSDRVKTLSFPLFPGYTFCRFNVHTRLPILVTPGVMAILGVGRNPMPVEVSEIEAIRHIMVSGATAEPWPYLTAGTKVRVESGALEGLEGIVLRVKDSDRLVVSVSLLMRSVAVEIDRASIKPVKPYPPRIASSQNPNSRVEAIDRPTVGLIRYLKVVGFRPTQCRISG